ncbi:hypothetical protein [Anatilimnocola aggregata]|nr:hypothetical protein [Anatilimnocola aggregata]
MKDEAQEKGGVFFEGPDGGRIYVRPAGIRRGPWFFDFALEHEGMTLLVAKRKSAEKIPNCLVDLSSMVLMQRGHVEAFSLARTTLERLGWHYEKGVASRCDICVDLINQAIKWFRDKYVAEAFVCRAVDDGWYRKHRKVTGIVFGKGIRCRIYDKVYETKDDPAKREVMRVHRWGGVIPEEAVRVEFQLRREEMRDDFSVTDIYDLFSKLRTIGQKLTTDWLRFTAETPDRSNGHQSRAKVADVWALVVQRFFDAFPDAKEAAEPKPKVVPDTGRLLRQAVGCIKSGLAQVCAKFTSQDEAVGALWDMFQLLLPPTFWHDINERQAEFQERRPMIGVLGVSAGQVPF